MAKHRHNCNAYIDTAPGARKRSIGSCISEMKTILNSERTFKILKLRREPKKSILLHMKHKRAVYRMQMADMREHHPELIVKKDKRRDKKRNTTAPPAPIV